MKSDYIKNIGHSAAVGENNVLYIYPDTICTKENKQRKIYEKYGVSSAGSTSTKDRTSVSGGFENKKYSDDRKKARNREKVNFNADNSSVKYLKNESDIPNMKNFTSKGQYRPLRSSVGRRMGTGSVSNNYRVRFESPGNNGGLKAESLKSKKSADRSRDGIYSGSNFAEKGKIGVNEAKKRAAMRRRLIEHRRGLILAAVIVSMSLIICFAVYKLFFVITEISVDGSERYDPEEIIVSSGVSEGMNLYSFRTSLVNREITFHCPYIEGVEIKRSIPNNIIMNLTEDIPEYYAEIYGEYKILSDGLRVLETVKNEESIPDGLIKLKIPEVSYSVAGRVMEFTDQRAQRVVRDTLDAVSNSPLSGRITMLDIRDLFDISMICDGKFMLIIGTADSVDTKLKTAAYVLEDEMFSTDNKMKVDLSSSGKTSVIIDNQIETK